MEIISVITIKYGVVDNIKSFSLGDRINEHEIVPKAEELFIEEAEKIGFIPSEVLEKDDLLDEGYYFNTESEAAVCLVWSRVE